MKFIELKDYLSGELLPVNADRTWFIQNESGGALIKTDDGCTLTVGETTEEILQKIADVEYEQKRYELTKSIIQGFFANPSLDESKSERLIKSAVSYADSVLAELTRC